MPPLLLLTLAVLLGARLMPSGWMGSAATPLRSALARAGRAARGETGCPSALGPALAALLSGALAWWVAGGWRVRAYIDDEVAYLLQARIFAGGHWVGAVPPFPEFFPQMHVLLEPGIMAKYPPLHSALLAVGVLAGSERVGPVLLAAAAGALVFALARRLAGVSVACVTLLLWLGSSLMLRTFGTYLSESTTSVLLLGVWWCVLAVADDDAPWGPPLAAALLSALAATRPLTGIALALPVGWLALSGRWRPTRRTLLASGAAACCVALAVLGATHAMTGTWFTSPLLTYTRAVLPFDVPGFGVAHPVVAGLPLDQARKAADFLRIHQEHTLANLPGIALERVLLLVVDCTRGDLFLLWALGLVLGTALVCAGPRLRPEPAPRIVLAGRVALASVGALLGCYFLYAHPGIWTFYYAEITPAMAFLGALGMVTLVRTAASPARSRARLALLLVVYGVNVLRTARVVHDLFVLRHGPVQEVWSAFERLPGRRVLVFVRYDPARAHNVALIRNTADVRTARLVTAYDRGAENERLARALPDRVAYRYDEQASTIVRLPPPGPPAFLRGVRRIVLADDAAPAAARAVPAP